MTDVRGINVDAVSSWLVTNVSGAVAPFTFDLIAGGRSNLTYKVTGADGMRFVLRRPPLGNVLASAHDMGREYKLITAVAGTGVPVAPATPLEHARTQDFLRFEQTYQVELRS